MSGGKLETASFDHKLSCLLQRLLHLDFFIFVFFTSFVFYWFFLYILAFWKPPPDNLISYKDFSHLQDPCGESKPALVGKCWESNIVESISAVKIVENIVKILRKQYCGKYLCIRVEHWLDWNSLRIHIWEKRKWRGCTNIWTAVNICSQVAEFEFESASWLWPDFCGSQTCLRHLGRQNRFQWVDSVFSANSCVW